MTDVAANVARVRERIASAARRSGRRPEDVTLVAVTKGVDLPQIRAAIAAGVSDLGENRVQEAAPKAQALGRVVRWHMVGHLQRNKVRPAAAIFDVIHAVDDARLATELSRQALRPGSGQAVRSIEILLQVNVAGEPQKFGVAPEAVADLMQEVAGFPGLRLVGLMTIAPQVNDPEHVRPVFRRLRLLRDELNRLRPGGTAISQLSMGMTGDFEVAVEEGATMVRIGRAIFGEQ